MRIKKRLYEISKLVEKDKYVIDVGTDHGLVPLFLAKNNITNKILATDISENSLNKLNSKEFEPYKDIIETKVTDGFCGIEKRNNQIAIIAGMGAITIIDIIDKNLDFAKSLDYMIIESNIANEKLRKYFNDNGFFIEKDFIVYEKGKYYDIMKVKTGKKESYDLSEIYYGKDNIDNKNPLLVEKLEKEYKKNLKFREDILRNSKTKEGLDILQERIKAIEEVYDKWR